MVTSQTINLKGLRKSDELIFSSILPLLLERTNLQITLSNEDIADITIIDVDSDSGRVLANTLENDNFKVIRLTSDVEKQKGICLKKPIRSTEAADLIVKTIKSSKKPSALTARLYRWPKKETIQSCLGSSRLCAIFIRNAISVERAAELSGLPYDQVLRFVNRCKEENCIELSSSGAGGSFLNAAVAQPVRYTSLFSKLREKLYSRN